MTAPRGLYDPSFEHDACGVGFVARISGQPDHGVVVKAMHAVANVMHRGAIDADMKTGDGAGILTQLPRKFFAREATRLGVRLEVPNDLAVGMFFLPRRDMEARERAQQIIEGGLVEQGLIVLGWRHVPVDLTALGEKALDTRPEIFQLLIGRPTGLGDDEYERALYLARRVMERRFEEHGINDAYIPSLSSRTIVYKGLFISPQLPTFYLDLRHEDFESAIALFHQRYSTNTLPNWFLAQPFRMLAHNGEINTLQGNVNWMRAREPNLASSVWGENLSNLKGVLWERGSDSAILDNALELLERSGRDLSHAMSLLQPSAWENLSDLPSDVRAFYEYAACLTEPWDGPAALALSDGRVAVAALDRNGLRPSRYKIDRDGLVVLGSEVGLVDMDDDRIVEKGKLGPGEMIVVDTVRQLVLKDADIKREIAGRRPYGEWLRRLRALGPSTTRNGYRKAKRSNGASPTPLVSRQLAFGYTAEEVRLIIRSMGLEGKDPAFSMGDDTPVAALSRMPRPLYSYFRQRFAQVTNPPIDPLREKLVMSLRTLIGPRRSLLEETPEHADLLVLESPMLSGEHFSKLRDLSTPPIVSSVIPTLLDVAGGPDALERAIDHLCECAERAVRDGVSALILSDHGVNEQRAPISMALAVGAVHHHLIRAGLRMQADIVAETGDAWDVHHFAVLIGYGAAAVHPYLAIETARSLVFEEFDQRIARAGRSGEDPEAIARERDERGAHLADEAEKHFLKAVDAGLLKIMSKMGISTVSSYRGAQIFEALGLGGDLVNRCFSRTPSPLGGIGFREIGEDVLTRHRAGFGPPPNGSLPHYGYVNFRRDGEYHAYSPMVVRTMQQAATSGAYPDYREYADLVNGRPPSALRDLLRFKDSAPVPLEEVEPDDVIVRRFISTAMSLGALSPEAHRTLAVAMNRIGARSNSGEGGEDPANYRPDINGDIGHNRIKQVASARFGVTAEYLAMADELEIKMAQGSKPGEGGQLPSHKVSEMIARLRHAVPGIELISPPPHHDIYSIEDLAQLIYDLKTANPRARVGVKLVAEAGVGTIAAGVAKAYADYILISGHSGGTGASPLSSIKNAGCPWELGLAETQQVLVMNDLRGRLVLRTDGGLQTGRDVVIAAMLGAEEFGFGTAAVVAMGCDMARQCHLNTCPTGIATQRDDLRAKFAGTPEMVIHFFMHLARDVRETLASLGFRSLDEVVGRAELLARVQSPEGSRQAKLDLEPVLAPADPSGTRPRRRIAVRNTRPGDVSLDPVIIRDAEEALDTGKPIRLRYHVQNAHRAVGTRLAGEIARRYGADGLPDGTIEVRFQGSAGQSFGAWATNGMRLIIEGEANDYVGKGLCGGEIIILPPPDASFKPEDNAIVGNVVLFGATSGKLFASGRAGERFAVRNSGAVAVVEGVGDHGCEYMTGGTVVILGETGRNFGAGMSNGVAYVLDEFERLPDRLNPEMVRLERPMSSDDLEQLYMLVREHFERTTSPRAQLILDAWDGYRSLFWKVVPIGVSSISTDPVPAKSQVTSRALKAAPVPTNAGSG